MQDFYVHSTPPNGHQRGDGEWTQVKKPHTYTTKRAGRLVCLPACVEGKDLDTEWRLKRMVLARR